MNEESTLLSFGGVCKAGDCLREVNIISFPLLFTCSLGNSGGGGRITGEFENSALGATEAMTPHFQATTQLKGALPPAMQSWKRNAKEEGGERKGH